MAKQFKPKFNIPSKKYSSGAKKMVSWRINQDLLEKLDELANEKGFTTTELVTLALDQAVVWMEKNLEKKAK